MASIHYFGWSGHCSRRLALPRCWSFGMALHRRPVPLAWCPTGSCHICANTAYNWRWCRGACRGEVGRDDDGVSAPDSVRTLRLPLGRGVRFHQELCLFPHGAVWSGGDGQHQSGRKRCAHLDADIHGARRLATHPGIGRARSQLDTTAVRKRREHSSGALCHRPEVWGSSRFLQPQRLPQTAIYAQDGRLRCPQPAGDCLLVPPRC
mmetsp:Transcript_28041/g.85661  ORF Transcript_28041/g.85661 Transcript_28041/m.85661 type:complete len:207 (-) Transcript_28041:821-1441(-)